ncbi:dihydroorotate dehydrogenase electron transfer subunit [Rossellomorea marisflavi]|uniref:dihydroorotate dehydrogenase electron transfer subunit n=1 Tax=Rossellomorea marisflavi TaxID=189381 RepID=UPI00064F9CA0|nr:dihydroorotate dehydrogenase electron transfer subunit [Rossellomorea marisflavi]KML32772.1 dihydroorotate dehydrogenase [Rossellomorea marisflavi]MCM2603547.1 dihydroorotate dehydrogenase electron transfer subunit [Rossellomorea marisflavi]
MIVNESMKVVSHRLLARNIYELVLEGELVKEITAPGQFVHVKVGAGIDPLLRRPISIAEHDRNEKKMSLIYRAEGKGTKQLALVGAGGRVDVLGPLGNGFDVQHGEGRTALLIGGGIGVPPLYGLSKALCNNGWKVTHVLGFQEEAVSFYEDKFMELGPTHIATVDGSLGRKGFVTDVIQEESIPYDQFFSCGPNPMLKALQSRLSGSGFLSLEERMGCGIGACFACVCHLANDPEGTDYVKVCSDGPVFPVGVVAL